MARDKVCVVIGAGDATGGAIARRFSREGYTAVVTRRTVDKLKHLVAEIAQEGGKVHPFGSDARDEEQVDARTGHLRFDIRLLATRLVACVDWLAGGARTSDLRILDFENVREIAFRPWAGGTIPRRFCRADAIVSDGRKRPIYYSIVEDGGLIGAT